MATNSNNELDPSAARDWTRPREKLRCEWAALKTVFVAMSRARIFHTTALLFFWMVWTAAILSGKGVPAEYYSYAGVILGIYVGLTLLLGIIIGRQWDISLDAVEANGFRLEFSSASTETEEDQSDES